jgi:hypothetical protein
LIVCFDLTLKIPINPVVGIFSKLKFISNFHMANSDSEVKEAYLKHTKLFKNFSDPGLVAFYNLQVDKNEPRNIQQGILTALRVELHSRKIDYSTILTDDVMTFQSCVIMVGNKLYKITELPAEVTEGLVMMQLKSDDQDFRAIKILECDESQIHYSLHGIEHKIASNDVIRSFTVGLLNPTQ